MGVNPTYNNGVAMATVQVFRSISEVSLTNLFNPPEADRHDGKTIPAVTASAGESFYFVDSVTLKNNGSAVNAGTAAAAGNYDLVVILKPQNTYDVFNTGVTIGTLTLNGGDSYTGSPSWGLSSDRKTLTLTFNNYVTYTPHSFSYTDNGNGTHTKACTVSGCGYNTVEDCTWNTVWSHDADGHWHVCTKCNAEKLPHDSHTPGSNRVYNSTQHWFVCTECQEILDRENHTFSYDSIDENTHLKSCTVCDYETTEEHIWDDGEVTLQPTTTQTGIRTYHCTCSGCAGTKEEEIPKIVPSGGGGGGNASGIGTGTTYTWGERAILNGKGIAFYELLEENDDAKGMLAADDTWTLAETDPVPPVQYEINDVYVLQEDEPSYWADETQPAPQPDPLSNAGYYIVDTQNGDKALNFKALKAGDLVRTTTFNGIYIANVTRTGNNNYEEDIKRVKSNIFASYRAFEFDHPEIFWLNGSLKLRVLTPTINGKQVSYVFLTTADASGFTMLIANYAAPNAIAEGIARRNACADAIYATLPKGDTRATIAAINKWLTMHNEYNRSTDLLSIGLVPHQCLCSLIGNEGVNGPVCDAYSKAFKMLCDRCNIPCVLVTGMAYANGHSEYHMWNQVMLNGNWYGVDCAWNDPVVRGIYGAVSGYENEKFLLVGAGTVIDGMRFDASHVADASPAGVAGITFVSLDIDEESDYNIPFDDMSINDWFYEFVRDVFYKDLMRGTSGTTFSPQTSATRGQIVQILYNISGQPKVKEITVEGWYGKAASWAIEKGIVAGYDDGDFHGDDPITREQLITMLWAYEGAPKTKGELTFADADQVQDYAVTAMVWAKKKGLIEGKPGNLADPQGTATRAEIATIFSNFTN